VILLIFIVARWRMNSKKEAAQNRVDLFERKKRLEEEGEYTMTSDDGDEVIADDKEAPLISVGSESTNFRTEEAGNTFDHQVEDNQQTINDSLFN